MLEILIVVLIVLWLTGTVIAPVGTSLIHLLLVIAIVILIVRVLQRATP